MAMAFRPYVPERDVLLPPSLRDWLPDGHLAFFVSDQIHQFDLSAITSVYGQDERGYGQREQDGRPFDNENILQDRDRIRKSVGGAQLEETRNHLVRSNRAIRRIHPGSCLEGAGSTPDGREPKACVAAPEAAVLRAAMLQLVEWLALKRDIQPHRCRPAASILRSSDAALVPTCPGGNVARSSCLVRCSGSFCSTKPATHARSCGRSAWGVLAEKALPARTLRFEVDHRVTRRRLPDRHRFDVENLVIACRSCNTVKAEMTQERFEVELQSLARTVISREQ